MGGLGGEGVKRVVPVLFGPTASGKSELALDLAAQDSRIEIIAADSRQVYRSLDVGTAKPGSAERKMVRHHMIDLIPPSEVYSAGLYGEQARHVIDEVESRGGIPLIVGGSGFYIRALIDGLATPVLDAVIANNIQQELATNGAQYLWDELWKVDPVTASRCPKENHARVVRALGCFRQTGRPLSSFDVRQQDRDVAPVASYAVLAPAREVVYASINRRFDTMVLSGLVDETREAMQQYGSSAPGLRSVGYREVVRMLVGEYSQERMVELGKRSTRQLAKRQFTWARGQISEAAVYLGHADVARASEWMRRVAFGR